MRILNTALRIAATGGKFLLLIFLLKYINEKEYAIYILMVATIGYLLLPLGLEFYTYSCREIISTTAPERASFIKNQFVLYFLTYIIIFPVILNIFVFEQLPWAIVFWFYIILMLEHLNQEIYRLLIALSEHFQASIILFIRQGFWPFFLITLFFYDFVDKSLYSVLAVWSIFGLLAFIIGLAVLSKHMKGIYGAKINTAWLIKGLKVSLPYLVSTVGISGVLVIDKYLVEFLYGVEYLASYSLYLSISLSLLLIIDSWIIQFTYQKMIIQANKNEYLELRKAATGMTYSILLISTMYLLTLFFSLDNLLEWTGKRFLMNNIEIIYYLIAFSIVSALSLTPHCGLYALKTDKWLTVTGFLNLPIFLIASHLLHEIKFENAIPLSLLITALFTLAVKFIGYNVELRKAELSYSAAEKADKVVILCN